MDYNPRDEWPMLSYASDWKTFRRLSDENVETALHLISREHWPRASGLIITDIGCGDGLLTQQIILKTPGTVSEVRLIDPDADFLAEAKRHLSETTSEPPNIVDIQEGAEALQPVDLLDVKVVLAVHVVYLMRSQVFDTILKALPAGVPLYVVLDEPASVFSRLWSTFAKKYLRRSKETHTKIASLKEEGYVVEHSTITSHIDNPLAQRRDVKDAILSILCYTDMRDVSGEEYEIAEAEVSKSVAGQRLLCESACYEIISSVNG